MLNKAWFNADPWGTMPAPPPLDVQLFIIIFVYSPSTTCLQCTELTCDSEGFQLVAPITTSAALQPGTGPSPAPGLLPCPEQELTLRGIQPLSLPSA